MSCYDPGITNYNINVIEPCNELCYRLLLYFMSINKKNNEAM